MAKELTLAELQKEIEALQAKAALIIEAEKAGVIEELKAKISQYGISAQELGFKASEAVKTAKSSGAGASKAPSIPMYRNPSNGETWHGGKGARPKWIQTIFDDEKANNPDFDQEKLHAYLNENGYKI